MKVVYGKDDCPNCVMAKNILANEKVEYEYVDIMSDDEILAYVRGEFVKKGKRASAPLIMIDDEFVGGCIELVQYISIKKNREA